MQKASESTRNTASKPAARAPPALDPERAGLVQPYKDFLSRGWITNVKLEMTPGSVSVMVTLGDDIKTDKVKKDIAPGIAKQILIDAKLWAPGNKGVKNSSGEAGEQLPKRSLCKRDFEGDDKALNVRIDLVAKAIGDERARGRIGSLRLMADGVDKFDKWWAQANPESRLRLLADKKAIDNLTPEDIVRFGRCTPVCPFRGEVPTPAAEAEEEEEQAPIQKRSASRPKKQTS